MDLKIEYINKSELKPYANNAKIHTGEQIEQIKNSIQAFGFNDPIAVWHDNEIVEGHGRLLAAMEMDEVEKVPVIRLDELTDEQRRAYMIAHNKLTMNTDFDPDILAREIESIGDNIDLTDFGFNEKEILELSIDDSPEDLVFGPNTQFTKNESVDSLKYNSESSQSSEAGNFVYPPEGLAPAGSGISYEDIAEYEKKAESLITRRVIIVYRTDDEESFLCELLHVSNDGKLNVIYDAKKLMEQSV